MSWAEYVEERDHATIREQAERIAQLEAALVDYYARWYAATDDRHWFRLRDEDRGMYLALARTDLTEKGLLK